MHLTASFLRPVSRWQLFVVLVWLFSPASAAPRTAPGGNLTIDPATLQGSRAVVWSLPRTLTFTRAICSVDDGTGLTVAELRTCLEIDPAALKPGWHQLKLTGASGSCDDPLPLELFLSPNLPAEWPQGTLTLWFDAGTAELSAPLPAPLQLLAVLDGNLASVASCPGRESCSLPMEARFLQTYAADPSRAAILVWPEAIPLKADQPMPVVLALRDNPVDWRQLELAPDRVVFNSPLIADQRLDTAQLRHELTLRYPAALEQIACDTAECRITPNGVLVFQVDPSAEQIKLSYTLKPHFFRQLNKKLVRTDAVSLRLEHCAIKVPPDVPLLGGTQNHRLFVKLPRECLSVTDNLDELVVRTHPPSRAFVKAERPDPEPGMRLFEILLDRVPPGIDQIRLTLFERLGVLRRLGSVRVPVATAYAPANIQFEVPTIGPVDFIPTNREATLRLVFNDRYWLDSFSVENRVGFFHASRREDRWIIQGEPGASGNVTLRLGYRPRALLQFISSDPQEAVPLLVTFDTEALFTVKNLNLSIPLIAKEPSGPSFIEVQCGLPGKQRRMLAGILNRIPYAERDSCRLIFHLDQIPKDTGEQRLRVQAGDFNQVVTLSPGPGELAVTIPSGGKSEYDPLTVSISHDLLSGHYTLLPRQSLGEELHYKMLLSDRSFRISATTALPTGMFRFSTADLSGSLPISAGALVRFTYVQDAGVDFPLGLELGLLGTNLSNTPDFSIVLGIGLSLPVLNQNTALQASFNIHAWAEFAPTRLSRGDPPFAFLFGPSFSVGLLSTTF